MDEYQPIYNVYVLWEGMILAEEGNDEYADAAEAFDRMVEEQRSEYRGDPDGVKGTTVHMYDAVCGIVLRETIID